MIESKKLPKGVECAPWAVHNTHHYSTEGTLFQQMVGSMILHGRILPSAMQHNPDGSQHMYIVPYEQLIHDALTIVEDIHKVCVAKGWVVEGPKLDELYDPDAATTVGFMPK